MAIKKHNDKFREKFQKEKTLYFSTFHGLFFLLFEQRFLQFHFSLDIRNYVAGNDFKESKPNRKVLRNIWEKKKQLNLKMLYGICLMKRSEISLNLHELQFFSKFEDISYFNNYLNNLSTLKIFSF